MTTTKMTLSIEIEVEVGGEYYNGCDGTFYRSNGDPGDAPEPPEFDILSILWHEVNIAPMLFKEGNFDFQLLSSDCIDKLKSNKE